MKLNAISTLIFCFLTIKSYSQQAIWQQRVDNIINVKLLPSSQTLEADITIKYINNSPNTLKSIWLHIWPNAYKNNETEFAKQFLKNGNTAFHFSQEEDKGFIEKLDFKCNNETLIWHYHPQYIDVVEVILNQALQSGDSIEIKTPFNVKLPKVFSRSGVEKGFFSVTQWYPKPAVYDVNGWNIMPYLDQGEFYSEFGQFKVNITVPENYMVAATGNLETQSEYENIKNYSPQNFRHKTNTYKTLTYTENNVHDFAWFADTCFKIHQSKVKLNKNDSVITWLFKSSNSKKSFPHKGNIMNPINRAITFYSKNVGNYPYKNCMVVIGPLEAGGGMEYPTITICDLYNPGLIMHEVGHNWFQGMLGTNERQYPWMDESINTFFEENYKTDSTFFKDFNPNKWGYRYEDLANYLYAAEQGLAQPLGLKSDSFTNLNYGCVVYGKGPVMFSYLKEKLGDSMFANCVKNYFKTWQYKHPLPKDMQQSFERTSGKNLDCFFTELMNDNHTIDYVKRKHKDTIKNAPLLSQFIKQNNIKNVTIGGYLPERNYNNNGQKSSIVKLHLFWQKPVFNRTEHINITPILGYNYYDKFYLGAAIFNRTMFRKKMEYSLLPAYAFGSKTMVGYGKLNFRFLPLNKKIYKIETGIQGQKFGINTNQYYRLNPYLQFNFKHKNIATKTIENNLLINLYHIGLLQSQYFYLDSNNQKVFQNLNPNAFMNVVKASYQFENKHKINNWGFATHLEYGYNYKFNPMATQYGKTWLTGKYHYQYAKNKYLQTDIMAGVFLFTKGNIAMQQFFVGGNNAATDYLYNEATISRSENALSKNLIGHQITNSRNNMRNIFNIAYNDKWLISCNNEVSLPGIIPLNIYADFAYAQSTFINGNTGQINYNPAELYTTVGLVLPIYKNVFELFAPIYKSKQFDTFKNYNFAENIGFKLNLNALHPFGIWDNLKD